MVSKTPILRSGGVFWIPERLFYLPHGGMHMGRKDPTFTPSDIVRFWCNNLESNERWWVFLYFYLIVPGILLTDEELDAIFEMLQAALPGQVSRAVIGILRRFVPWLRRLITRVQVEIIFYSPLKEEIIKCIDKILGPIQEPPLPPPDLPELPPPPPPPPLPP